MQVVFESTLAGHDFVSKPKPVKTRLPIKGETILLDNRLVQGGIVKGVRDVLATDPETGERKMDQLVQMEAIAVDARQFPGDYGRLDF